MAESNDKPAPRRGALSALRNAIASDVLAKAALAISVCGLFFGFGAATILFKTFPYEYMRDAAEGLKAYAALEGDHLPTGFESYTEEHFSPLAEKGAGNEYILMTGGPYRRLDLCPTFGCLAWIADRDGRVIHAWEVDIDALIADDPVHVGRLEARNLNPIGLALGSDGSLVATFHGRNLFPYQVGIAKFNVDGTLLWKRFDLSHHWFDVDGRGFIFTPYANIRENVSRLAGTKIDLRCGTETVYDEGVRVISPDGEVVKETSFMDLLGREDYRGLFYGAVDGCDPLHVNSVDVASEVDAAGIVGEGDLLASIREMSAIVLLDGATHKVKRMIVGRTAAQHSARFLQGGRVAAFDNLGGDRKAGGSRVFILDLNSDAVKTLYPRQGDEPFHSQYQGHIDASADGRRLLVSSTGQGRVLEIDAASGRELWRYREVEPTGAYREKLGVKPDGPRALYNATGAYYVADPSFLKRGAISQ